MRVSKGERSGVGGGEVKCERKKRTENRKWSWMNVNVFFFARLVIGDKRS